MQVLKNITIEYRFAALFGAAAFLVSFFIGILSGIGTATVIIRSLVASPLFAIFGFAVIYVIKRYVPEFYELISGIQENTGPEVRNGPVENPEDAEIEDEADLPKADADPGGDLPDIGEGPVGDQDGVAGSDDHTNNDETFSELKGEDFPSVESITNEDLETPLEQGESKLGKHIIIDEQFVKYEPKIMAEAVRTMMSKDED